MAYRASKVISLYIFLFLLSTISTYGLSVGLGHIDPLVPYLGFLGDQPLESTVFTQFFVIVAVAFAVIVQIEYISVAAILEKNHQSAHSLRANTASLYIGYIAAFSLFVLACFQESHAYYVHHIAEILYLLDGIVYCGLHTFITIRVKDAKAGVRSVLNIFMMVFFVLFLVAYVFAMKLYDKPWDERYHWDKKAGGWLPHVISATSEWLLIILFHCYLCTFYSDMNRTLLTKTSIIVLLQENEIMY